MNIGKLGSGSYLKLDICNGARKTIRLIIEQVNEAVEDLRKYDSDDILVLEVDCWNHFKNVWLGGVTNALSNLLGNAMKE